VRILCWRIGKSWRWNWNKKKVLWTRKIVRSNECVRTSLEIHEDYYLFYSIKRIRLRLKRSHETAVNRLSHAPMMSIPKFFKNVTPFDRLVKWIFYPTENLQQTVYHSRFANALYTLAILIHCRILHTRDFYITHYFIFEKFVRKMWHIWFNVVSLSLSAVSHMPQSGDATTSPAGDAASPTGDVDVSAGDAHL
jgi:hypothetical protein